ncbi:hypothetical protein Tco_0726252 [Tanacetum coccineum]|uniref:Uncharacterized protein n=1 Tax=Tanacetum coccineum TaxID=301880 RepID=A0ABQ4YG10_9ASTR
MTSELTSWRTYAVKIGARDKRIKTTEGGSFVCFVFFTEFYREAEWMGMKDDILVIKRTGTKQKGREDEKGLESDSARGDVWRSGHGKREVMDATAGRTRPCIVCSRRCDVEMETTCIVELAGTLVYADESVTVVGNDNNTNYELDRQGWRQSVADAYTIGRQLRGEHTSNVSFLRGFWLQMREAMVRRSESHLSTETRRGREEIIDDELSTLTRADANGPDFMRHTSLIRFSSRLLPQCQCCMCGGERETGIFRGELSEASQAPDNGRVMRPYTALDTVYTKLHRDRELGAQDLNRKAEYHMGGAKVGWSCSSTPGFGRLTR